MGRKPKFFAKPKHWDIEATRRALQKAVAESTGLILTVAVRSSRRHYFSSSFLPAFRLSKFMMALNTIV